MTSEHETVLQKMVSLFSLPACIINVTGEVQAYNTAFIDLISKKHISLDATQPFYPEYRKQIAKCYLKALKGVSNQCFAIFITNDNKRVSFEIFIFPIFDNNGTKALFAIFQEVEDRLLSFDKSTESINALDFPSYESTLYDLSPFPILQIDQAGNIVKASASVQDLIGYQIEELQKNRNLLYRSLNHYDFARMRAAISHIFEGIVGYKRIGEIRLTSKDKEEKWVNATCYPVRTSHGVVVEIILEDISRVKRLESQLQQLSRYHIIGDLTKGFMHSFNNIINVILNKAQWLLQTADKPSHKDGLQQIIKSSEDSMLQIRRIEEFITKDGIDEEKEINIVEAIEDAIEFAKIQFKVDEAQKRRYVSIERRYFALISFYSTPFDFRDLLLSCLFKVASAIAHKGTIEVTLKKNTSVTITMKTQKSSPEIPYETSYISTLELSKLAEKIHVKLLEEESLHEYAITIILPQDRVAPLPNQEQPIPQTKIRDKDICIIEDEPALQEIMYEVFDALGNRVSIFNDAEHALETCRIHRFDIVIADYGLPGTTGLELLIKVKEFNENTITVLLTGWILNNVKAYKNVIDVYIHKPFKLDMLINEIAKVMSQKYQT